MLSTSIYDINKRFTAGRAFISRNRDLFYFELFILNPAVMASQIYIYYIYYHDTI